MNAILAASVLAIAAIGSWIGTLCLLLARSAYDRLHWASYTGLVSIWGVSLAIVITDPLSTTAAKAIFLALFTTASGAVLSHAIARAILLRERSRDGS